MIGRWHIKPFYKLFPSLNEDRFDDKILKVTNAPEPNDINWQNIGVDTYIV